MNKFQTELQFLRQDDDIQEMRENPRDKGYSFITTARHGYLVVPKGDKNYKMAKLIAEYGYVGYLAVYLEEDSEAGRFLQVIK